MVGACDRSVSTAQGSDLRHTMLRSNMSRIPVRERSSPILQQRHIFAPRLYVPPPRGAPRTGSRSSNEGACKASTKAAQWEVLSGRRMVPRGSEEKMLIRAVWMRERRWME